MSGGSAKGAAQVGAIKALTEWDLEVAHYVGTSIGSVMAACFASGLGYDEILRRVSTLSRRDVASLSPRAFLGIFAGHLFKPSVWRETIEALVPARSFDDLETPLTVTAVDAASGDLVLFGAGGRSHVALVDALCASCALPLYFPPARIGDREYVDGGLRAVLPLDVAGQFDPDILFAVNTGPMLAAAAPTNERPPPGLIRGHRNAMRIMMAAQTEEVVGRWVREQPEKLVLVQPRIKGRTTFAVDRIVGYVERGYRAAHRALADWERP
ncbi:MAG: patatin-like phospholipase family protein [Gemmatimonadetes bacterium]|nr:patatin-like phospholipase family protein [Gemmatimonadota bacterium]